MKNQAWSFKTVDKNELRYYGNEGYDDDPKIYYRYDNFVANHKRVKTGDIVFITNRENVIGISIIHSITEREIKKKRFKCPEGGCNAKKINHRKQKKPEWICANGHDFPVPKELVVEAIEFKALYDNNFSEINLIDLKTLIEHTPRYNVQSSIQEIEYEWAHDKLSRKTELLDVNIMNISKEDANQSEVEENESDERKTIERAIKIRRGQKKFRNSLLKKGAFCAVTGCNVIEILEAAHISAYRNDSHNKINNGLLLRSDIHTLYDLNLIAINPEELRLTISPKLTKSEYNNYDNIIIKTNHKLLKKALMKRWISFIKNNKLD